MKVLAVKKDRLKELIKFGFEKDEYDSYIYRGKRLNSYFLIQILAWDPTISISEHDEIEFENDTVVDIPDVIMELIEAGMVESYEDD